MITGANSRVIHADLEIVRGPFGRPISATGTQTLAKMLSKLGDISELNGRRMELRSQFSLGAPKYFILVPTLRCNISCDYCQVSRVAETARGFDWDDKTCENAIALMSASSASELTVEFQGGEPLLRLDIIERIHDALLASGKAIRTVICTNLQSVSEDGWRFFARPNVFVSTSFDGTFENHDLHRTRGAAPLATFRSNLDRAISSLGHDRVSLTSTINPASAPRPEAIIDTARTLGIRTLFLRPVNFQGFARKAYREVRDAVDWDGYYLNFLDALIRDNASHDDAVEEYYFSYILRRILDPRRNEHVDLRNPAPMGQDYLVVGEHGDIFPTDEARMLYRIGQIDLRIGHVATGLDAEKIATLNGNSDNRLDATCRDCVYQAVCGPDVIDDISRYGRMDMPRHETRHCQRHMTLFDFAMMQLATPDQHRLETLARMTGLPAIDPCLYQARHV